MLLRHARRTRTDRKARGDHKERHDLILRYISTVGVVVTGVIGAIATLLTVVLR